MTVHLLVDDYDTAGHALGFAPEEVLVQVPSTAKVPHDVEISVVHAGKLVVTYRLHMPGKGVAPVTVKATRYRTLVCLTCLTHDRCAHAKAVARYIERVGAHTT